MGIAFDGTNVWVSFNTATVYFAKLSGDATSLLYGLSGAAAQSLSAGLVLVSGVPYAITVTAQAYIIILNVSGTTFQICDGTTALQFQEMISAGAVPKRAAAIRHYASSNGVDFYLMKEVSLLSGTGAVTWGASAVYDTVTQHFYHQSGVITIDADDQATIGALAQVILGRDPADQGAYPFLVGAVAGLKTFVGNVLIGGEALTNQGIVCAQGEDAIMNDVFPNDQANVLDLEYSDGDQIKAILALGERSLFLKRRNAVLVSPNYQTGGYDRDIIDRGHGACSQRACNVDGQTAFYMDYFGARALDTGSGGHSIGDDWILDWQAIPIAYREAAISIIDIINRQYIVSVQVAIAQWTQYVMDLDTGEWISNSSTNIPVQFADNAPDATNTGVIDFLDSSVGIIWNVGKNTLQGGSAFPFFYETNRIEPLKGNDSYLFDTLPQALTILYNSSVDINFNLYLDDSSTPANPTPYTLSHLMTEAKIWLPMSLRCKGFRLRFYGTITGYNQTIQIKFATAYYDKIPAGGDVLAFNS
jgi:hypothetical protein